MGGVWLYSRVVGHGGRPGDGVREKIRPKDENLSTLPFCQRQSDLEWMLLAGWLGAPEG